MKFGIFDQMDDSGRPLNVQYEERMQLVELYDQSGFHCYHQSEHHATPLSMAPSQNVFLAALTQRTKRIKLCPLVYLLPIHHPIRLAEEICMLDQLSSGRFEFGVGRGINPHEIEALGVSRETLPDAYLESYEIMKKFFTTGAVDHVGKVWNIKDYTATMRPFQTPYPAMWYATATADSAVWPARQGMNIICRGTSENVRAISDRYRLEAAQAEGGARAGALLGIWQYVVVAETDEAARRIASQAWPRFRQSFYHLWNKHGTEPQGLKLGPDFESTMAAGQGIAGSPATVAQALIQRLRDGKVNYLMSHFMFGDMAHDDAMNSTRLFARDVMPAIQEASLAWL
jgi:alkanesulfonate monooxygenase SsuD/methylene tetrahydromethanopterin reductase-like flavin-dependent oxidoreductase (luciferase family)